MTLTQVTDFIKNKWLLLLLLILVIFLTIVVFGFRREKPELTKLAVPQAEIKQAPNLVGAAGVLDLSFLQLPEIPKRLAIYQAARRGLPDAGALVIAQKFGITVNPQVANDVELGKIYNFIQDSLSLSVSEEEINFSQPPTTTGSLPNVTTAAVVSEKFLREKNLWAENLVFETNKITYSGENQQPVEKELAVFIKIPITFKVSGFSFVSQNPKDPYSFIEIGRNSEVVRLRFRHPPQLTEVGVFQTKDEKTIFDELKQGKGKIVYANTEEEGGLTTEDLPLVQVRSAKIKNVSLAYYDPIPRSNQIVPVFVFEGDFVDIKGQVGVLTLYLPAIANQ